VGYLFQFASYLVAGSSRDPIAFALWRQAMALMLVVTLLCSGLPAVEKMCVDIFSFLAPR